MKKQTFIYLPLYAVITYVFKNKLLVVTAVITILTVAAMMGTLVIRCIEENFCIINGYSEPDDLRASNSIYSAAAVHLYC